MSTRKAKSTYYFRPKDEEDMTPDEIQAECEKRNEERAMNYKAQSMEKWVIRDDNARAKSLSK